MVMVVLITEWIATFCLQTKFLQISTQTLLHIINDIRHLFPRAQTEIANCMMENSQTQTQNEDGTESHHAHNSTMVNI